MSCNVKMCVRHTRDLHVRFQLNQYRMLFHTMCVCTFRFNLKFTFPSARLRAHLAIPINQLIHLNCTPYAFEPHLQPSDA